MMEDMKAPLFIRPLSEDERHQVQAGLRSKDAFVLRRGPILLASERGQRATAIASQFGCHRQTVLNVIHGFNTHGLEVLQEGSSRPHRLRTTFSDEAVEALQDLLHRSPRDARPPNQCVDLAAGRPGQFQTGTDAHPGLRRECPPGPQAVGHELETRQTLDHQPRSAVPAKKNARDRLIAWASQHPDWATGFLDARVVESFCSASYACLAKPEAPRAPGGTILAKGRPRSQSPGLLWCVVAERVARGPGPF
jgi:hypothetical protein